MYLATIELPIEANENVNYETWMENFLIANRISTHTHATYMTTKKKKESALDVMETYIEKKNPSRCKLSIHIFKSTQELKTTKVQRNPKKYISEMKTNPRSKRETE